MTQNPKYQHISSLPKEQKRLTLGYMTNGVSGQGGKGGYHSSLWKGIQETAKANDVNLVCFLGNLYRVPLDYEYEYQSNHVFDLITEDNIDGLIISCATLIPALGSSEIDRICDRFTHLPVVSIGMPLKHYPFLSINNQIGEKELVDHLIEKHGYRQIAFIRGPQNNQDAEIRYQAYWDSLASHGIPFNPDLIVQGDFIRSSGVQAANLLLAGRRPQFNAVVAANDNMAIGFIASLQEKGIQVPADVAVVGFDDIQDAKITFPALTTVCQPIFDLGQRAVEQLLMKLQGEEINCNEVLPTRVIIRTSCGCSLQDKSTPNQVTISTPLSSDAQTDFHAVLTDKMVNALGCSISQRPQAIQQVAQLKEGLAQVLEADATLINKSLNNLSTLVNSIIQKGPILPWHRAISIYSQMMRGLGQNKQKPSGENDAWEGIWELTSEAAWFSQSFQRLQELAFEEEQLEQFRNVSQALVTTFHMSELMETAYRLLPKLGIKGCWLSVYEEMGDLKQQIRLKLAYDQQGRVNLPEAGQIYPAYCLLPKDILDVDRSFEVIVNSLNFGQTIFGFVVYEMDRVDQKVIDMVTSQISTALQGTKVVNELQFMEAEFRRQANTDLLTGVYNRRMLYTLAEPTLELARRHNLPLAVGMIDLDNFKHVNDKFGHAVGDQVLKALCSFVQKQIRGADIFGRFGGEEFLIVLPETSVDGAVFLVERIRKSIEEHPFVINDLSVPLTISVGVAGFVQGKDQIIDNLIDKADKALYQAKNNGKNCVSVLVQ